MAKFLSLAISPDEKWLASGSDNGEIKIWNVENCKCIKTIKQPRSVIYVTFSFHGKWLASVADCTIQIWNTQNWTCIKNIQNINRLNQVRHFIFSSDNQKLICGFADGTIQMYNTEQWSLQTTYKNSNCIKNIIFSPDSKILSNLPNEVIPNFWGDDDDVDLSRQNDTESSYQRIFSPDEKWVVNIENGILKVCNTKDFQKSQTLDCVDGAIFSPDSRWLATFNGSTFKVWATGSWMCLKIFNNKRRVTTLTFFPHRKWLVVGFNNETLKMYDLEDEIECLKLELLITLGLGINGKWHSFLTQNLYDPRLFIFIVRFLL